MSEPDFQSFLLPRLRMGGDGMEHSLADARGGLASEFKLGQADQEVLLPSGPPCRRRGERTRCSTPSYPGT